MKLVRVAALPLALVSFACAPSDGEPSVLAGQSAAILNGHPATAAETWGTVGLEVNTPGSGWTCTGTLIAPRVVVTAAHCVLDDSFGSALPASAFHVIAGVDDLFAADDQHRFAVTKATPHELAFQGARPSDPSGLGQDNDIAVIVTSEAVRGPTPVPLFPLSRIDELLSDGSQLVIAGYGVRSVEELEDPEAPTLHYVGAASFIKRTEFEFLAGKGEVESDTCVGDSGGPVYVEVDGTMTLLGATSRGRDDAEVDCGAGGIYTLVPAYQAWLEENADGALGGDGDGDGDGDGSGDGDGDGSIGDGDGDGDGDGEGDGEGDSGVVPPTVRKKDSGCSVTPGAAPESAGWFFLLGGLALVARRVRTRTSAR